MVINIYADGFGRWHVLTTDTANALSAAVEAMAQEIVERGTQSIEEARAYVHENIISAPKTGAGLLHFIEYRID